ncbi:MAG: sugar transferase [Chloroflexi bacterium]|nr:sugar transferase [Chloroflexota bacterium]
MKRAEPGRTPDAENTVALGTDGARALSSPDPRPPTPAWYEPVKRGLDVGIAVAVLGLLAPLWGIVALAIRLTSPGPVLYRGVVVGRNGRPFTYNKFRSMRVSTDDTLHKRFVEGYVRGDRPFALETDTKTGKQRAVYKVVRDPRVTSVGRILRATSLDEIPQLINVLRGEMSVIGPRPPVYYEYEMYDDWARQRLAVRPGITGLAQVEARGTASFSEMVKLDLEYIRRRSLWLDLTILLRTVLVVVLRKGYTG